MFTIQIQGDYMIINTCLYVSQAISQPASKQQALWALDLDEADVDLGDTQVLISLSCHNLAVSNTKPALLRHL